MTISINRPFQMIMVTRYELLKYIRGKKLLASMIVAIAVPSLILALPMLLQIDLPRNPSEFLLQFVGFLDILIVIGATFFGSDALVSEFQQKTGYTLFPNPITRIAILFGKYLASSIATLIIVAVFYGVVAASSFGLYSSVPIELVYSLSFAVLYTFTMLALAFFISSLVRGTTGAAVLTFMLFFLILPIVDFVLTLAQFKPWFSATFASGIMLNILIRPYPKDVVLNIPAFLAPGGGSGLSITNYVPELNLSIGVLILYLMMGLMLSLIIFRRKEMT